eukprot:TRINITY_DN6448_c0_g1_i1.p1 TRINITY_DN6448_c0_g1~~TRINITY_DN6448_c0_g1_i1.p1  ORF type:complete len:459 (-),score=113.30 TRINITY_DN6448_c0_g1_i1:249-1625(-)
MVRTANTLITGLPSKAPMINTTAPFSLKLQSLMDSISHVYDSKALVSALHNPGALNKAIFEPNMFVQPEDLISIVQRASGSWARKRRDQILSFTLLHQDRTVAAAASPLTVIEEALTEVSRRLRANRAGFIGSTELEAVSGAFEIEHEKMMRWVENENEEGLPQAHFTKFILDMCCRGLDLGRFEAGLTRLIELSGITKEVDESEAFVDEYEKMKAQRREKDRWVNQKMYLSSADHKAAASSSKSERGRAPQADVTQVASTLRAHGTQLIGIVVEGALVSGPVDSSQSAWELRKKVNGPLSELAVAAATLGVQVALLSKEYPAKTVQSLADQIFVPASRYGVLIRCGGARANLVAASATHPGGNIAPEKMLAGDGKAVIVPGHVRAQKNFKQWNLESAMARLRQKGVTLNKASSIVIDSDQSDVESLQSAGYRASLFVQEDGYVNLTKLVDPESFGVQ